MFEGLALYFDKTQAGEAPHSAEFLWVIGIQVILIFKGCLPRLLHSFKNKFFNEISLDNMLYFISAYFTFIHMCVCLCR